MVIGSSEGELDHRIQAVAELRREDPLDRSMPSVVLSEFVKPMDGGHFLGSRIRRHHEDDVPESALGRCCRSGSVVHDLPAQVEHVRVSLLDFIEQQHAMGVLGNGPPSAVSPWSNPHTRRRADQARDRVPLHVLRHVEPQENPTPMAMASCRVTSLYRHRWTWQTGSCPPACAGPGPERAILMAAARDSIALSCRRSRVFRCARDCAGPRDRSGKAFRRIRAMRATMSSKWRTSTTGSRSAIG